MTRMYEALRLAEQEQIASASISYTPAEAEAPTTHLRSQLTEAYQKLDAAIPGSQTKIFTFASATPGEGTSTLAREFAKLLSGDLGKRVVLVDGERGQGRHFDLLSVEPRSSLEDAAASEWELGRALQSAWDDKLFVANLSRNGAASSSVLAKPGFKDVIEKLRSRSDVILFDAPPFSESADALALARISDGLVLVVEAEKARWQVLKDIRNRVEKGGGKVLGAILNRRQQYIPSALYCRL